MEQKGGHQRPTREPGQDKCRGSQGHGGEVGEERALAWAIGVSRFPAGPEQWQPQELQPNQPQSWQVMARGEGKGDLLTQCQGPSSSQS